ncbi:MAG TPA: two-component regulator propeller domain-containing protein [Verrucomicrobiae bacterium]
MNIRWFATALLVLGCLGAELPAAIPTNAIPAKGYDVRAWETDSGLPQSSVMSMVQTRDGYLWLGTFNGLARFDGIRFTVFDESNTQGLKDSRIVHVFEDSAANLWIGTATAGTVLMKQGRITAPAELSTGGVERRLIAAAEDAEGAVWLYLANGDLWRYYRERFTPHVLPAREPSQPLTIFKETNGPLWVATGRRQFSVGSPPKDSGTLELPIEKELAAGALVLIVPSRRGGYWRLANLSIQKWETDHFKTVGEYRWFGSQPSAGCEDLEGNLIVGTERAGVFIVTPAGEVTSLSTTNNLSRDGIRSVMVDREGTLWVGTDGGGLNRVKRRPFDTLEAVWDWTVWSVTEDAEGGLWIASNGNGVGYWQSNSFQVVPGLANAYVKSIFADRRGRVWAGTLGGLHVFRNGRFDLVVSPEANLSVVQAIHQDRWDRMWFGTGTGLLRLESNTWKRFTARDGLSSEDITAVADDASGEIWIGTRRGGLNRLREGKITAVPQAGQMQADISGLYEDKEGALWIATFGAGLGRFQHGKWTHYTRRDGLASHKLSYLTEDGEGNLWIGSIHGVLRISKKALNDFAAGSIQSIPCRTYGKTDGLPSHECTAGSQPGPCRDREGKLWFPTIRGLASIDPKRLKPNMIPPLVTIDSIWVDDELLTNAPAAGAPRTVVLRPRQERLAIQYSSLNLGAPDRARFRYWLEGEEKAWTETSDTRVGYRLDPGEYRFQVTACNEDGVWNRAGSTLAVIVQPPFWRTWWFYGASAGGLLALVGGIVHYLSTQKLQRQLVLLKQKEALEKERARIARDIHDQVGASLTQVALLGELVETDKDLPDEVQAHAKQISQTARDTTHSLDEIVWTVNPSNDTLEGLVNYICKHAQDFLRVAGLRYRLEVPEQLPALPMTPEVRHNVFLASKEAVTNIVRHAKATAAWIRLRLDSSSFTLEIEDNGCGIADPDAPSVRNGLRNMRKRMDDIGGTFSIGRGKEGGALVRLTVPITSNSIAPVANTK